ncbi:uncharacterized protein EI90DRAFT_2909896, partial [Cantharellus anzutake]|uniref:uncharacterized protein n=1 Tax=Cantharellus anzutake TaxID=1750568 RepID=UPI001905ECE3
GSELSSGSVTQFGGITHVNNNHWVAFLISPTESTIYLADSLRAPTRDDKTSVPATEAICALQWWLDASYLELNKSVSPFWIAWLPIAYQNDLSSCGFFALNALMHHLNPTKYSLCDCIDTAMLHIRLLTSILNHHATHVSEHT